ncbi:MAG: hypothetical protein Q8S13_12950, partial [Dehalococcoidia bacterium]|nr:hypothetical protein [Dehalococcoidia bacterium]
SPRVRLRIPPGQRPDEHGNGAVVIRLDPQRREVVLSRQRTDGTWDVRRFPLVSGHACPECGLVVRASWEADEECGVQRYEEPPGIAPADSRYQTAFHNGIESVVIGARARMARRLESGPRWCCRYLPYTKATLRACLADLLTDELGFKVWPREIAPDRIGNLPGLWFVPDLMHVAEPVVLYDPVEFARIVVPDMPPAVAKQRLAVACGYTGTFTTDEEETP